MDLNALANEMQKHGHSSSTAWATINGRSGDSLINLWNEYMPNKISKPSTPSTSTGSTPTVPTAEEYAKSIVDAQQKQIDEETKFLDEYKAQNPFVFDEELARKSATAEYEPYYSEILKDYVSDLEVKRQTTRGEADLLKTLHDLDVGTRTRAYQNAVANAEEGYAGRGMFFSGARNRTVGQQDIAYKTGMEEAEKRFQTGQAGYESQLGEYNTAEERKRRDIFGGEVALGGLAQYAGRQGEYQTALESGILQRKKEATQGYNVPFEQAYYRKYGNANNLIKGYTIPDYYT